jgi:hypothetical protein
MSNNTINEIKQVLINNLNGDDYCRRNCIEILNRYMNIGPDDNDTLHEILRNRYNNDLRCFADAYSYHNEVYDSYGYDDYADYINMNNCTLYSYSDLMDVYLYLLGGTREHEEYEKYSEIRIRMFVLEILRTINGLGDIVLAINDLDDILLATDNLDNILLAINEEYGLITL